MDTLNSLEFIWRTFEPALVINKHGVGDHEYGILKGLVDKSLQYGSFVMYPKMNPQTRLHDVTRNTTKHATRRQATTHLTL